MKNERLASTMKVHRDMPWKGKNNHRPIFGIPEISSIASSRCSEHIHCKSEEGHERKISNKNIIQRLLKLKIDDEAPILFWPTRLSPIEKDCQLLTEILFLMISNVDDIGVQLVIIGETSFQHRLHEIVDINKLHDRVALRDFDNPLSALCFAAADFVLMPSSFAPSGLKKMIDALYGNHAIDYNSGGLHNPMEILADDYGEGNDLSFGHFDSNELRWAIARAMAFHRTPALLNRSTSTRCMGEINHRFNTKAVLPQYFTASTKQ